MPPYTHSEIRQRFVGLDLQVPTLSGEKRRYINFDNAASTPPMQTVKYAVDNFMSFYSSVHRGTGFKSQLSTHAYEEARKIITQFVGGNSEEHVCIFGKNTTEALNKLARRFPFQTRRDIVLTTGMEHHSNDLPWRSSAKVIHVGLTSDGQLDLSDFDSCLARYHNRIALVAVTGASNVTGFLNPIYQLAEKAHAIGAQIVVDCAQLAPHRRIDIGSLSDPAHLDYITISAHKMYAPFGTGALIGRKDLFENGPPDYTGGGTVEIVTLDEVVWADPPDRDEAGSPNTVGAIALAAAIQQLEEIGMDTVAAHESELTAYALSQLPRIPGMQIFGDSNPDAASGRVGAIPFRMDGISHFLIAAILGHEFAIGVRSGCFCAHPYILSLLGLDDIEAQRVRDQMVSGDKSSMPGLVRASFGLYNNQEEIDLMVEALHQIAQGTFQGEYVQDRASGEFIPRGWEPDFADYFSVGRL